MGETSNGHQKWKDWFFDYGVFGDEGLSLVDGYFRGQRMFNKLSLPVIRVKYLLDEQWGGITAYFGIACGPYNDKIFWDTEDFLETLNPIIGDQITTASSRRASTAKDYPAILMIGTTPIGVSISRLVGPKCNA